MRERTVLDRKCAAARRARAATLGAHAAEGEGKGKGDAVPGDDPEPLATRVPADPPPHARTEPGPPRPRRRHPEEPVDRQHRGLQRPHGHAQAHAPLRKADRSAADLPVMIIIPPKQLALLVLGYDTRSSTLISLTSMSCSLPQFAPSVSSIRILFRSLLAHFHLMARMRLFPSNQCAACQGPVDS